MASNVSDLTDRDVQALRGLVTKIAGRDLTPEEQVELLEWQATHDRTLIEICRQTALKAVGK